MDAGLSSFDCSSSSARIQHVRAGTLLTVMCGLTQEAAPLDDSREAATTAAVVNAASKAMHALLQVIQHADTSTPHLA